jgi:2-octaprenyl-6-methoxyphenol hydroxylase
MAEDTAGSTPSGSVRTMNAPGREPEVTIVGAGPVGALAALALTARGVAVSVCDAREPGAGKADRRALALSWGTHLALSELGVWPLIAQRDPIRQVSVSQRGAFGGIEFTCADLGSDALGYVVDYGDLAQACVRALQAQAIDVQYQTLVQRIDAGAGGALEVAMAHASRPQLSHLVRRNSVVLADGAEGIAAEASLRRHEREYRQVALVGEVVCERFQPGRAFERFIERGPLALLPRADHYACVWVLDAAVARAMLAGSAELRAQALAQAAGPAFGAIDWRTLPREVPLVLRSTQDDANARVVTIGNAAQTLHPVAGQGFNLGVRDALALAAAWPAPACRVTGADRDPGSDTDSDTEAAHLRLTAALARFRRERRADRSRTIATTDLLARVGAIDLPGAAAVRGLGMAMIDLLPGVRRLALERLVFGAG